MNDRPMRPNPLMPTRTAICVSSEDPEGATTAERESAFASCCGSCPIAGPRERRDRRRDRLGAERGDRRRVDRQPVVGVVQELVDPAAVLADRRQVVGPVEAGRLVLRGQVRDLDHPARRAVDGARGSRGRRAPPRCSCTATPARGRSGRRGRSPRARPGRRAGRRGRAGRREMRPRLPAAAIATWPRHVGVADARRHRHRTERGREHAADRAEQAARLVERGGEVAERLGQADQDEVAERVVGELAGRNRCSNAAGHGPSVARERDEAAAEVAGRGHDRDRAAAGRSCRRRRRRSRPR